MHSIESLILDTHMAAASLRNATNAQIVAVLEEIANRIDTHTPELLYANSLDVARQDAADPKTDRLTLTEKRLANIANSIRQISKLPNPSGKLLEQRTLYNGLQLQKMAVPLGVVAAIYESRPNVTFDIAALCLRSMNGCLLKGSSDAENSNKAAVNLIKAAIQQQGINANCVSLLPAGREYVQQLFTATKYVDVIIPRGSDSLIQYVRKNSLVPVIETGAGVCHVYVHAAADLQKAVNIVYNAKVSRPSVCNALDCILVDDAIAPAFFKQLFSLFAGAGVQIFAEARAYELLQGYPQLHHATNDDFAREFISLKCAAKVVTGFDDALQHIAAYSTKHSEAIVSEEKVL